MSLNSDWPDVDPGEFRHEITLLEARADTDASGVKTTYVAGEPPTTAWAKIEYVRATEVIKAGLDVSQVYLKLTMWYRPEFTGGNRIQAPNGSQFIIQAAENVRMMNMFQVITCLGVGANA